MITSSSFDVRAFISLIPDHVIHFRFALPVRRLKISIASCFIGFLTVTEENSEECVCSDTAVICGYGLAWLESGDLSYHTRNCS